MAASELIIRIGAESKEFQEELDKISSQTEDLESQLSEVAKISGVIFAGLVAEAGLAIKAFGDSEKASNKLSQSLQNQGIYSKELADDYKKQAEELQNLTGIDDDSIVAAQASLQAMIGQTKISKELTQSIADLSVAKDMDLQSTAELIGKGIQGHTTALKKLGIEIDDNLSKEERTAQIIEKVTQAYGQQAAAANQGVGSVKGLKSAFSDLQEEIGARLAPAFTGIVKLVTEWITSLKNNKPLLDTIVHIGTFVASAAGLVTGLTAAAAVFLKFRTVIMGVAQAFGIARIGLTALLGASGIGLLALILTELVLNWKTAWPKMQAVFKAFVDNIGTLGQGLGNVLIGALTLNPQKLLTGLQQIKDAFRNGLKEFKDIDLENKKQLEKQEQEHQAKQNAAQKAAADKAAAEERRKAAIQAQIVQETEEQKLLKLEDASADRQKLQAEEIELLKILESEKNQAVIAAATERLNLVRGLEETAREEETARSEEYFVNNLDKNEEYHLLTSEQQLRFIEENQAMLISSTETEQTIRQQAAKNRAIEQQKANNLYLEDQRKFGTAYAAINKAMHSEIYQGSKQAFGELAQLQQSSNSTLKAIGKAAAIANIIIKTAESAMSIYAGFSTIPIIGPALGVAGAAAAVAFGAEQIGRVTSAAEGGLITGGVAGRDSVPSLLMPGELVVPTRNFSDVVNAVANQRVQDTREGRANIAGVEGMVSVAIGFDGDAAADVITARQVEQRALGTLREA